MIIFAPSIIEGMIIIIVSVSIEMDADSPFENLLFSFVKRGFISPARLKALTRETKNDFIIK